MAGIGPERSEPLRIRLAGVVSPPRGGYLAFWSASDGHLFAHDQVRTFSVAYVLLSLCGLLVSIPVWRLLGFLS